nr:tetratricopeptide repeat protein [Acidobacteriota bacterium]
LAANSFRRAIDLDPDYAAPYGNLARVRQAQGNDGEAARLLAKRAELRARDPVPDYRRGLAELASEPGKAIESFRRALDLDREFIQARLGLARAYLALGNYDAAERQVRRALRQSPHNKEAAELLATFGK